MLLNFEEIKKITFGYADSKELPSGFAFYRMKESQVQCFASAKMAVDYEFVNKCYATAGVYFDFYTDSKFIRVHYVDAKKSSSREWYYFDVLVNGKLCLTVGEEQAEKRFGEIFTELDGKENRVTLFFPNLFRAEIKSVELSDGAKFYPAEKKGKIVAYGDSITQGYDARKPSLSYANILGFQTGYEVINLGVGSAFFEEVIIDETADYNEDFVTIALGINDFGHHDLNEVANDCKDFLQKISKVHKDKPIFLILPLNYCQTSHLMIPIDNLVKLREKLTEVASWFDMVTVIDTTEFLSCDKENFSPDGVHPVEKGFIKYAEGLKDSLEKYL